MQSQNYKSPACESGVGNVSADVQSYTFAGNEPNGTVVLMRRMSEYNSYLRITAIAESGMTGSIDIGYASRDENQIDDTKFFKDAIDLSVANQAVIADVREVPFKHDITILIATNNAGNADKKVKLLVEFINTAG